MIANITKNAQKIKLNILIIKKQMKIKSLFLSVMILKIKMEFL